MIFQKFWRRVAPEILKLGKFCTELFVAVDPYNEKSSAKNSY